MSNNVSTLLINTGLAVMGAGFCFIALSSIVGTGAAAVGAILFGVAVGERMDGRCVGH